MIRPTVGWPTPSPLAVANSSRTRAPSPAIARCWCLMKALHSVVSYMNATWTVPSYPNELVCTSVASALSLLLSEPCSVTIVVLQRATRRGGGLVLNPNPPLISFSLFLRGSFAPVCCSALLCPLSRWCCVACCCAQGLPGSVLHHLQWYYFVQFSLSAASTGSCAERTSACFCFAAGYFQARPHPHANGTAPSSLASD
jgi:hypothetical protein